MNRVTLDLEATMNGLDGVTALKLELLVRDAIELARLSGTNSANVDAHGWPVGYWEKFGGCLADEKWSLPEDAAPDPAPEW